MAVKNCGEVPWLDDDEKNCFVCGSALVNLIVFWQGSGGQQIGLHYNCGEYLASSLLADSISCGMENNKRNDN